jgi:crotonobetainyl-CoA:carnitine CoA-transferase CaiB-like acyl-CoA transferase
MLPFSDLVVLDFARGYPGAYTTMFLGDFGAEVIRIDPPQGAVYQRRADPDELAAYHTVHRNKKSIIINLRNEQGQAVLHKLVKKADVLLEGFRPGVMARLNAGYETLKETNPRLIYCSLSGFGPDGPYASFPGHDMNYIGLGGVLSLIGPRDGPPCLPSNFIADMAGAGLHGVIGILIALAAREKTGKGQFVDIAYLDSTISLLAMEAPTYFRTGAVPRRGEHAFTGGASWANVYRCKDGEYITLGCLEPHFWENLCRAIDREDLIPLQNPPLDEADRVKSELAGVFLTRTRDEWFEFFKDKNTCVGPVYYLNETFSDPQVLHRGMVTEIEHPRLGKIKQLGLPIKLSDTPGKIRSLGTPEGAHTEEILLDLGYSQKEIESLRCSEAVGFIDKG